MKRFVWILFAGVSLALTLMFPSPLRALFFPMLFFALFCFLFAQMRHGRLFKDSFSLKVDDQTLTISQGPHSLISLPINAISSLYFERRKYDFGMVIEWQGKPPFVPLKFNSHLTLFLARYFEEEKIFLPHIEPSQVKTLQACLNDIVHFNKA